MQLVQDLLGAYFVLVVRKEVGEWYAASVEGWVLKEGSRMKERVFE